MRLGNVSAMSFRRRKSSRSKQRAEKGRKAERIDAPQKDHVNMSTEERLVQRLQRMELPKPPPGVRERSLSRYKDWLNGQQGRNRWRDD
jgi:hypothetical protein